MLAENLARDDLLWKRRKRPPGRWKRCASGNRGKHGGCGTVLARRCGSASRRLPGIGHPHLAPHKRRGGNRQRTRLPDVRLVLSYEIHPALTVINPAHSLVLSLGRGPVLYSPLAHWERGRGQGRDRGEAVGEGVCFRGTSDLAIGNQKFSGNSMRCRRRHFLYHGTILYNFPLEMISRCLKIPPWMPDYRNGREHGAFVANLPAPADTIGAIDFRMEGRGTAGRLAPGTHRSLGRGKIRQPAMESITKILLFNAEAGNVAGTLRVPFSRCACMR